MNGHTGKKSLEMIVIEIHRIRSNVDFGEFAGIFVDILNIIRILRLLFTAIFFSGSNPFYFFLNMFEGKQNEHVTRNIKSRLFE